MKKALAIDIGASSGRHMLGSLQGKRLVLEEIHRFENRQIERNGHLCWDMEHLWQGILHGLKACAAAGKIPSTVGVDTWAVDFVLLDEQDRMLGDAVGYRDARTQGIPEEVDAVIPPRELYARTGIQRQAFNTLYQLVALKKEHPEQLEAAKSLLMIPDYFHFLLTGVKRQEYTNASSTGLLDARTRTWDRELIGRLGLPQHLFGRLSMPGETVGRFRPQIAAQVGFDAEVVLPATHDTGSAFLAVPAQDDRAVYLSSGTWSLLGMENSRPITTEESFKDNFTNEGGAWCRYRYLKNIMGLWMIQSVRRELNGVAYVQGRQSRHADGRTWDFAALAKAAGQEDSFHAWVDVNRACFLAPESMIDTIRRECARTGQRIPESVGQIMRCVYESLALCYKEAVATLEERTGRAFTALHIVGGGCQDALLNRLTAAATGLPVYAGPVEGTAIGNLIVQLIAQGALNSLEEARAVIRQSFDIKTIAP